MRRTMVLIFMLTATIGLLMAPTGAKASDWNRETIAVFHNPVEIPGHVLPAGIYVFKLADVTGDHNTVQVWNAGETVLYATVIAAPDYLTETPSGNRFVFEDRENGAPPLLKSWFHQGNPAGETFMYPGSSEK